MNCESALQPLASGSVTLANMKISAVDGTAFVDFSAAGALTSYEGALLEIFDSANRSIKGIIKADGVAETYGDEMVTNGDFASDVGWTLDAGWAIAAGVCTATNVGADKNIRRNTATAPALWLLKWGLTVTSISGGTGLDILLGGYSPLTSNITTTGAKSGYFTGKSGSSQTMRLSHPSGTGFNGEFDDFTCKKVLTPSATGVTIVNSKGGSTYNWIFKDAAFDYASATFTYKISRIPANVVASGAVTQANTRLDLTSDNAFVELNGVDLSPYQDGKHIIGIYNATGGFGLLGHISATAPAGETLDVEIIAAADDRTFASDTGWWSKSEAGVDINVTTPGKAHFQAIYGGNGIYRDSLLTSGCLYKFIGTMSGVTSGGYRVYAGGDTTTAGQAHTINGTYTDYITQNGGPVYIFFSASANGSTFDLDDISAKRVTDPVSTGARIVSTKGGATRAWYYKHASFNPNDTAGITYKIYYIGD